MSLRNSLSLSQLSYEYPPELVATEPVYPPRVMWVEGGQPRELAWSDFLQQFKMGDVLVLNETQVLKRRIFTSKFEILFLNFNQDRTEWEVLFPSRDLKVDSLIELPGGVQAKLIKKGRPQRIHLVTPLSESYFQTYAELPLPPYIQKARGQRHTVAEDSQWYQTAWARKPGSLAAPTASLHFRTQDIDQLQRQGVQIERLTLHVGLGTFLPLTQDIMDQKELHREWVEIPQKVWDSIQLAKSSSRRVWALGTTVARSLESCARGYFNLEGGVYSGETTLFLQPGDDFLVLDGLLTNFHQPESSLLALVQAFSGSETTKLCYQWAIEKRFRLFSYGDFSAWIKP